MQHHIKTHRCKTRFTFFKFLDTYLKETFFLLIQKNVGPTVPAITTWS